MSLLAVVLIAGLASSAQVEPTDGSGPHLTPDDLAIIAATPNESRFMSMGCWGGEKHHRARQRAVGGLMAELAARWNISYTVAAGDNFYTKGIDSVASPRWGETFETVYPKEVQFLVALGNHDYRGSIWAQVNYTFSERSKGRWWLPYPYYSVSRGGVFFVVIDTVLLERCEVNKNKPALFSTRCWDGYRQREWIAEQLGSAAAAAARYRVVVGHYPILANGPHVNQPWLLAMLTGLFEKHRVAAYINADNHYLQYSLLNGVHYVNAGGGAGYMAHLSKDKGYEVNKHSKWVFFGDGVFVHFASPAGMLTLAYEPSGVRLLRKFVIARPEKPVELVKGTGSVPESRMGHFSDPSHSGQSSQPASAVLSPSVASRAEWLWVSAFAAASAVAALLLARRWACFRRKKGHRAS
ncbi:Purple acid phosphatase 8 [Diplonema papillatum]|nr:Purple acid phosphatase 8 [Diplonema papillatum]